MKIIISGYYGHGNFGDEAILESIISELKSVFENPEIIVLSKIPNLFAIKDCDLFISGGGSLLQDVTSVRSLIYYLGLLYFAIRLKKKTMVYAQGIGPVKSNLGRKFLHYVLKQVDLITVRDEKSANFLKSMEIDSEIVADPVWALSYAPKTCDKQQLNLGIQLRKWPKLNKAKLEALAAAVKTCFKGQEVVVNLISLQDKIDVKVLKKLERMFEGFEVKLLSGMTVNEIIDCISRMDCLIAMRYHACLIAAKYGVPFMAITYDPKVRMLAKDTNAPFVLVKNMNFSMLANGIKYLIKEKDVISSPLRESAAQKAKLSTMKHHLRRFLKYERIKPGILQAGSENCSKTKESSPL